MLLVETSTKYSVVDEQHNTDKERKRRHRRYCLEFLKTNYAAALAIMNYITDNLSKDPAFGKRLVFSCRLSSLSQHAAALVSPTIIGIVGFVFCDTEQTTSRYILQENYFLSGSATASDNCFSSLLSWPFHSCFQACVQYST